MMSGSGLFFVGLAVFFGAHLFAALRPRGAGDAKERIGANTYRGLFSLVSAVGLILLIYGYGDWRHAVVVWDPPLWTRHIPMLLMIPAAILFVAAEAPAGRIKRAVKHPMLAGVKIWAFSHLLANGDLASVILFGAFLAYAVFDRIAVKRRAQPEFPDVSTMGDVAAVVGGLAVYLIFVFWAHAALIGVPVFG